MYSFLGQLKNNVFLEKILSLDIKFLSQFLEDSF